MEDDTDDDMGRYLKNIAEKGECDNCGEPIKFLHFEWGKTKTYSDLITILNTILDEDEILGEPFQYDRLKIEYCQNCGVIDLHLE